MITEKSIRLCPECNSRITINHTDKTIKFHGQPGFCLCRISEEDLEELGDLSDYGKEVNQMCHKGFILQPKLDGERTRPEIEVKCFFCSRWFDSEELMSEHMKEDHRVSTMLWDGAGPSTRIKIKEVI